MTTFMYELLDFYWANKGYWYDLKTELAKSNNLDYTTVGMKWGKVVGGAFEFSIPVYKYNTFGKSTTTLNGKASGIVGN